MASPDKGFKEKLAEITQGVSPKPEKELPPPDPEAVREALGACAWCFAKPVFALDVEQGAEPVATFQYVYLAVRSVFTPGSFRFQFEDGEECWRLTVTGRNLRPVFDRMNEHRIRRIRVVERDFAPDGDNQPVITGIEVKLIEETK
jgi:hypothetical protein